MNRRQILKTITAIAISPLSLLENTQNKTDEFIVCFLDGVKDRDNEYILPEDINLNTESICMLFDHKYSESKNPLGRTNLKICDNKLIAYNYTGEKLQGWPSMRIMCNSLPDGHLTNVNILEFSICSSPNSDPRIPRVSI